MSSQPSHKRQLVESIKSLMNKSSVTTSPKNSTSKKPDNYTSYLNTQIDYTKDHTPTPYLVPTIPNKNQIVYSLDSDESPKEDQHRNNKKESPVGSYDDELMKEIEQEIYQDSENKL